MTPDVQARVEIRLEALPFEHLLGPGAHWSKYLIEADVRSLLIAAETQLRDAQAEIYEPNIWTCSQCGFVLVRSFLRASDGAVGIDASDLHDICPNDGASMRRQTYKESADQAARRCVELLDQAHQARWQPIETAPKDGTRLLLARRQYVSGEWTVVTGYWSSGGSYNMPHWSTLVGMHEPTHWQRLSPPEKA